MATPETTWNILGFAYPADAWTAWFTGGLLAVGIASAVILIRQLVLIERQVKLAREEFAASHKPRIILRDVSVVESGGKKQILFMLVNIGDAEATLKHSWRFLEFVAVDTPVRPVRAFGHVDLGATTFQPGQYFDFIYEFNQQEIDRQMAGVAIGGGGPWRNFDTYFVGALIYADRGESITATANSARENPPECTCSFHGPSASNSAPIKKTQVVLFRGIDSAARFSFTQLTSCPSG